jgi:hypothetical protein
MKQLNRIGNPVLTPATALHGKKRTEKPIQNQVLGLTEQHNPKQDQKQIFLIELN